MSRALMQILARPWNQPIAARWYEPDLVIVNDLVGPTALRDLVDAFGPNARVRYPERFCIVSSVDRHDALPDRISADELLESFAADQGIEFIRDPTGCIGGCTPTVPHQDQAVVGTTGPPLARVAARGGVCLQLTAADVAGAMATGRVWAPRPVIRRVNLAGNLPHGVTFHDLALVLADQLPAGEWLAFTADGITSTDEAAWLITLIQQSGPTQVFRADPDQPVIDDPAPTVQLEHCTPMVRDHDGPSRPLADDENLPVDRVFLGSCRSGSLRDLALAASVLEGHQVTIPTTVAPATIADFDLLSTTRLKPGGPSLADVLTSAGCDLGLPGCSGCVNALADLAAETRRADPASMTCLTTGIANPATRKVARVLTASPVTAARTALVGSLRHAGAPVRVDAWAAAPPVSLT